MNVKELIETLEDFDPDAEVRFVYQPNYPLVSEVGSVAEDYGHAHDFEEIDEGLWACSDPDCDEEKEQTNRPFDGGDGDEPGVVYIGEGSPLGYLQGSAREALGWSR